jgi:hypothetical protein
MYSPTDSAEGTAFRPIPAWPTAPVAEPLWRRSDRRGLAVDFNPAWLQFTERSAPSSARNGWLQDVHPEDRGRCLAIHAEMHEQRLPYTLDFRLHHTRRGHCWLMERATPLFLPDGHFDGFDHHCTDVQDRVRLEEDLAERSRRMRCTMRAQALFATALATELDRLPPAEVRSALGVMARLAAQAPAVRRSAVQAGPWLRSIAADIERCGRAGATAPRITPSVEALSVSVDPDLLAPALANAIVCSACLQRDPGNVDWRVDRVGRALVVQLPASAGSSGFVLLDLAVRLHGCVVEPVVADALHWRVALPLAESL